MLRPYEIRIHLNVLILIRYDHGAFYRTAASYFLSFLRQQYRFAAVNSII